MVGFDDCRKPPLDGRLRVALADAVDSVAASEATLWWLDGRGRLMAALNCGACPEVVERRSVGVSDSIVGLVASSGLGTCIGPEAPHNQSVDQAVGFATLGMVAVPIFVGEGTWGVLSAINPRPEDRRFGNADIESLQEHARVIAEILRVGR